MATVDLTETTFEETIKNNDMVIVDWWASWCGPCRMFAPTFSAASEAHPDIVFAKVDTEANQSLAAVAGIMSIPTLMIFREQILVFSQPGALAGPAFDDLIQQVRDLDMVAVHASVAEQSAQP